MAKRTWINPSCPIPQFAESKTVSSPVKGLWGPGHLSSIADRCWRTASGMGWIESLFGENLIEGSFFQGKGKIETSPPVLTCFNLGNFWVFFYRPDQSNQEAAKLLLYRYTQTCCACISEVLVAVLPHHHHWHRLYPTKKEARDGPMGHTQPPSVAFLNPKVQAWLCVDFHHSNILDFNDTTSETNKQCDQSFWSELDAEKQRSQPFTGQSTILMIQLQLSEECPKLCKARFHLLGQGIQGSCQPKIDRLRISIIRGSMDDPRHGCTHV